MPAIMMIPASGDPASVTGKSSDIAETGPMPGSTPTSVPMNTPMKQESRFRGWSATEKPCPTLARRSMRSSADLEDAGGELDQEQALQNPPDAEGRAER